MVGQIFGPNENEDFKVLKVSDKSTYVIIKIKYSYVKFTLIHFNRGKVLLVGHQLEVKKKLGREHEISYSFYFIISFFSLFWPSSANISAWLSLAILLDCSFH